MTKEIQSEQQVKKQQQWSRTQIRSGRSGHESEQQSGDKLEMQQPLETSPQRDINAHATGLIPSCPPSSPQFVKPSTRATKKCCLSPCVKKEAPEKQLLKAEEKPREVPAEEEKSEEESSLVCPKEGQSWMQLACENRAKYFEQKEKLRQKAIMDTACEIMRCACEEALEKGSNSMPLNVMPEPEVCKVITDQGFDITEQSTGLWSAGIVLSWKLPEKKEEAVDEDKESGEEEQDKGKKADDSVEKKE